MYVWEECMSTAALLDTPKSQKQPTTWWPPHIHGEMAFARKVRGREGTGSDTPGVQRITRKGEPILNKPGLSINSL